MSKTTLLLLAITLSLSTAGAQDPAAAAPPAGAFDLAGSIQRGKGVYMQTCLVCHQATGLGLPGAFPPIAQTDYTTGDARRMVAIVLKGVMGPIKVKDITYNNIMLPVDVQFPFMKDDSKVADVVNYVRNAFGNKDEKGVTPEFVTAVRSEFAARTAQWTEAELLNFPAPAK
ncbi:MAG: cycA 2 [Chthoniobacter sp.]|jgi:mono/diheme cytochrome c family protein|nr:cycA 2 [Chthoniobacter sp.]